MSAVVKGFVKAGLRTLRVDIFSRSMLFLLAWDSKLKVFLKHSPVSFCCMVFMDEHVALSVVSPEHVISVLRGVARG